MRIEKTKNVVIVLLLLVMMGLLLLNHQGHKEKELYQSALEEAKISEGEILTIYQAGMNTGIIKEYYKLGVISEEDMEQVNEWEVDFLLNPSYEKAYVYKENSVKILKRATSKIPK